VRGEHGIDPQSNASASDLSTPVAFATAWMPEVEQRMAQLPDPTCVGYERRLQ